MIKIQKPIFINEKTKYIFIGMPGCGKSTFMKKLLLKGISGIDVDFLINNNIEEFSKMATMPDFEEKEHIAFKNAMFSNYKVISTGGSVPCNIKNRLLLKDKKNVVVWFDVNVEELNKRVGGMEGCIKRGVCFGKHAKNLEELYTYRFNFYEECSHIKINNSENKQEIILNYLFNLII